MDVVGTPGVVRLNGHPTEGEPLSVSGGAICDLAGDAVSCARGGIAFSFSIMAEDVLYKGAAGHDSASETAYERAHVPPALAQTMGNKLPG